jgi:hypothetical protein
MEKNSTSEHWKVLKLSHLDITEKYAISDHGRVKSFKCHEKGKIINCSVIRGYKAIVVKLSSGKYTSLYLHKLVAELFLERAFLLQKFVIHKDYDKSNNNYQNLYWVTFQTMNAHQKLNPNNKVLKVNHAKLSEEEVKTIKLKLKKNVNVLLLAKKYGITHTQVYRIKNGQNWKHVNVG